MATKHLIHNVTLNEADFTIHYSSVYLGTDAPVNTIQKVCLMGYELFLPSLRDSLVWIALKEKVRQDAWQQWNFKELSTDDLRGINFK